MCLYKDYCSWGSPRKGAHFTRVQSQCPTSHPFRSRRLARHEPSPSNPRLLSLTDTTFHMAECRSYSVCNGDTGGKDAHPHDKSCLYCAFIYCNATESFENNLFNSYHRNTASDPSTVRPDRKDRNRSDEQWFLDLLSLLTRCPFSIPQPNNTYLLIHDTSTTLASHVVFHIAHFPSQFDSRHCVSVVSDELNFEKVPR